MIFLEHIFGNRGEKIAKLWKSWNIFFAILATRENSECFLHATRKDGGRGGFEIEKKKKKNLLKGCATLCSEKGFLHLRTYCAVNKGPPLTFQASTRVCRRGEKEGGERKWRKRWIEATPIEKRSRHTSVEENVACCFIYVIARADALVFRDHEPDTRRGQKDEFRISDRSRLTGYDAESRWMHRSWLAVTCRAQLPSCRQTGYELFRAPFIARLFARF